MKSVYMYLLEEKQMNINLVCCQNVFVCFFAEEKYGREVCIIAIDFVKGQEIYPVIADEVK